MIILIAFSDLVSKTAEEDHLTAIIKHAKETDIINLISTGTATRIKGWLPNVLTQVKKSLTDSSSKEIWIACQQHQRVPLMEKLQARYPKERLYTFTDIADNQAKLVIESLRLKVSFNITDIKPGLDITKLAQETQVQFQACHDNSAPVLEKLKCAINLCDVIAHVEPFNEFSMLINSSLAKAMLLNLTTLLSELRDNIKNRNVKFLEDPGWMIFDVLAHIIFRSFLNNELPSPNDKFTRINQASDLLFQRLFPIIHAEIVPTPYTIYRNIDNTLSISPGSAESLITKPALCLKDLLQLIYTLEYIISKQQAPECDQYTHRLLPHNLDVLINLAALTQEISDKLLCDQPITEADAALSSLIATHNLLYIPKHIREYCKAVNNYLSLCEIQAIAEKLANTADLSQTASKHSFLFLLVQLGEHMANYKLTPKFKNRYPGILWDKFINLRNILEHQETNGVREAIYKFTNNLIDDIQYPTMIAEFSILKEAITEIIEIEYENPDEKFEKIYLNLFPKEGEQVAEEKTRLKLDDKDFLLSQIQDENIRAEWALIIEGKQDLPPKTELGKLYQALPTSEIKARANCIDIISNSANGISEEDKQYLLQTLVYDSIEPIQEILNTPIITKKGRNILQSYLPEDLFNAARNRVKKLVEEMYKNNKLTEALLNPVEKRQFTKTAIYRSNSDYWNRILSNQRHPGFIDWEMLNPAVDLEDKVKNLLWQKLQEKWLTKLAADEIQMYLNYFDIIPDLKGKWVQILNDEIPYPNKEECKIDRELIVAQGIDAKKFDRFISHIKPIQAHMPETTKFIEMFFTESEKITDIKQILLQCITLLNECESAIKYHYDMDFITTTVVPFLAKEMKEFREQNPNLRKLHEEQEKLRDDFDKFLKANPEKMFRYPIERFYELCEKYIGSPAQLEAMASTFSIKFGKNWDKMHNKFNNDRMNELLSSNIALYNSIFYYLTSGLGLLKNIIRLPQARDRNILFTNYHELKRFRNKLVHGDYIRKAANAPTLPDLVITCSFLPALQQEFELIALELGISKEEINTACGYADLNVSQQMWQNSFRLAMPNKNDSFDIFMPSETLQPEVKDTIKLTRTIQPSLNWSRHMGDSDKGFYILKKQKQQINLLLQSVRDNGFNSAAEISKLRSNDESVKRLLYLNIVPMNPPKYGLTFFNSLEHGGDTIKNITYKLPDGIWSLLLERENVYYSNDRLELDTRVQNGIVFVFQAPADYNERDEVNGYDTHKTIPFSEVIAIIAPKSIRDSVETVFSAFPKQKIFFIDKTIHNLEDPNIGLMTEYQTLKGADFCTGLKRMQRSLNLPTFAIHTMRLPTPRDMLKVFSEQLTPDELIQCYQATDLEQAVRNMGAGYSTREDIEYIKHVCGSEILDNRDNTPGKMNTALHHAIRLENWHQARALLLAGARTDIPNADDITAKMLAQSKNINLDDLASAASIAADEEAIQEKRQNILNSKQAPDHRPHIKSKYQM